MSSSSSKSSEKKTPTKTQPKKKARREDSPASSPSVSSSSTSASTRMNLYPSAALRGHAIQTPKREWTTPERVSEDYPAFTELNDNSDYKAGCDDPKLLLPRRPSIENASNLYSRPESSGVRHAMMTLRMHEDVDCPVIFLSFEGNAQYMCDTRYFPTASAMLKNSTNPDGSDARDVIVEEISSTFDSNTAEYTQWVADRNYYLSHVGDAEKKKKWHDVIRRHNPDGPQPEQYLAFGRTQKPVFGNATGALKHGIQELSNLRIKLGEGDIKAFYESVLATQLNRLGFSESTRQRHGLPRLIFLCEEPLAHPPKLTYKKATWDYLGDNTATSQVQRLSVYCRPDDAANMQLSVHIMGGTKGVVVRVRDRINIGGVHMSAKFTGTKKSGDRINNINLDIDINKNDLVESWGDFFPDVVLGDLNMDSKGLPHGVYPSEEIAGYSNVERSNAGGDEDYMGGFVTNVNICTVPTTTTWGKRSLPPLTLLPTADLRSAFSLTTNNDTDNTEYIYSDHPSLYANFAKIRSLPSLGTPILSVIPVAAASGASSASSSTSSTPPTIVSSTSLSMPTPTVTAAAGTSPSSSTSATPTTKTEPRSRDKRKERDDDVSSEDDDSIPDPSGDRMIE